MTAWVLVLAGVTAGDGGMGMGAAREPVAVGLDGWWEGEEECQWDTTRVDLRRGVLRVFDRAGTVKESYRVCFGGKGRVSILDNSGRTFLGIFRLEGRRLLICVSNWCSILGDDPRPQTFRVDLYSSLLTLRPVPRKP
jgi:hypothetical protein